MPYIHEYWDSYHGIYDPDWWLEEWASEGVEEEKLFSFDDYENPECETLECEWVDCHADQIRAGDTAEDCWKELCTTSCNSTTCVLWHWDTDLNDWVMEDCE